MPAEAPIRLVDIHAALVAVIAVAHADVDLSGDTRVAPGLFAAPPGEVPFACVAAPEVRVEEGRARRTIWEHTATFRVRCWAPCTDDQLLTRVKQSIAIGEQLVAAIEDATNDQTSILFVVDPPRIAVAFDQVLAEQPTTFASADLLVEIRFRRVAGT